jgi:hypothetical protein
MRTKTKPATTRINVSLPEPLLQELRELVPPRERNQFIVELIEREVKRLKVLKALELSFGAWSDEDHPDLMTVEDVDRYVRRLREGWVARSWEEIAEENQTDAQLSTRHQHSDSAIATPS